MSPPSALHVPIRRYRNVYVLRWLGRPCIGWEAIFHYVHYMYVFKYLSITHHESTIKQVIYSNGDNIVMKIVYFTDALAETEQKIRRQS